MYIVLENIDEFQMKKRKEQKIIIQVTNVIWQTPL